MQFLTKLSISSLLIFCATTSFANTSTSTSDTNLITIQPHTRSAAVNAKHAQECSERGGIDVTDTQKIEISKDVVDTVACEITDRSKFMNYYRLKTIPSPKCAHSKDDLSYKLELCSKDLDNPNKLYTYPYTTFGIFTIDAQASSKIKIDGIAQIINMSTINYEATCSVYASLDVVVDKNFHKEYVRETKCAISEQNKSKPLFYKISGSYYSSKSMMLENNTQHGHGPLPIYSNDEQDKMINFPYDEFSDVPVPDRNAGIPDDTPSCNMPNSFKGNPINIGIGNKFQQEVDIKGSGAYPLSLVRSYNSTDNIWRHNYSMNLQTTPESEGKKALLITDNNGRVLPFYEKNNIITSTSSELGHLKRISSGYEYTSPFHETYDFNESGLLTRTISTTGLVHDIKYDSDTKFVVTDNLKHSLTLIENEYNQLISVKSSDGKTVDYQYDNQSRLVSITKNGKTRIYHYENMNLPKELTGITDENGIRYVTWTYDAKGRANSSTYFDGKDKITITYNTDTQTTFTNPLGRKYTYNYTVIDNVKRITSIKGDASGSQCPAINTSYEYNSRGLVTLKTDGKGIKTSYTYNDAGQETSRTIGVGTPEALTIKTTWDSRFFNKPQTVTYPDKIIKYSYDAKGNATNQTIQSLK